jgi:5'-nucleotidase
MRLLISNDDGVTAAGVRALANTLVAAGHDVTVVCPDQERSATGHSITLHHPIRAQRVEGVFDDRITAWSCSGTPSDCVKLAIWSLMEQRPEYVISGINQGSNLGTDVVYSGTVSAAMEGLIEGIPSIAISLTSFTDQTFQPAANFACQLLAQLIQTPLPEFTLLNVNVPAIDPKEIKGVKLTRQGLRRYIEVFEKRQDPRGKTYYWLAGEVVEDVEDPEADHHLMADVEAIRQNFITLTPLQFNLTHQRGLLNVGQWLQTQPNLGLNLEKSI